MKPTQLLESFRNIRKEFVAFASIVVIGLLAAVAFLSIVYSAATLKTDALNFFNSQNLWDLEVTSTLLMTEEDLETIQSVHAVGQAERVWQVEARLHIGGGNTAVSVVSLPETISLPVLREGRLPERVGECAVEKNLADDLGLTVGQLIEPDCGRIMEIDPLTENCFLITGIFHTPDHFSYMVPATPYVFVTKESFNTEGFDGAFMKARIRIREAPEDRYSDEYREAADSVAKTLETVAGVRAPARVQGIQSSFDENIRAAEAEIEAAREVLRQNLQKIEDGWHELEEAEKKLGATKKQLDAAGGLIVEGRIKLKAAREHLENGDLNSWIYEEYGFSEGELQELFSMVEQRYEKLRNQWYFAGEEYLDGVTHYQKGKKLLEEGERELAEGEKQLRDAEEKLREAKEQRDGIGPCRWIVLDDNSNPGFLYALANADKLSSLSMSFSSIFLVVGVLVIYATISRMVEQQRKLIGVNKALGLFNREIFAKYLLFACGAVILGVGLGILLAWLPIQRAVLKSYESHLNYGAGTRSFLTRETQLSHS